MWFSLHAIFHLEIEDDLWNADKGMMQHLIPLGCKIDF